MLVERSVARQWNVTIQAGDDASRDRIDSRLWEFSPDSFLPHGKDGDDPVDKHPIFVTTTGLNQNASNIRFVVENAELPDTLNDYERVAIMFDGRDDYSVNQARSNWKNLKDAGHALTYWKQSPEGKWERQG